MKKTNVYNMRNIFLEKSYTKCDGEIFPHRFLKNENWAYLWINSLEFYTVECYWKILKLS